MKLVITGASGFIGRRLSEYFSERGHEVIRMNRELTPLEALKGAHLLIHLAAKVHDLDAKSNIHSKDHYEVNCELTSNIAIEAAKYHIKRFIFISSIKVNGENTKIGQRYSEQDLPNPQDDYAKSKWEAEKRLQYISQKTGIELVIIRSPLVYGPKVGGNLKKLIKAIKYKIPLPLLNLKNLRSFIALDNLVDFIYHCSKHPKAKNQLFLISDGCDISSVELIKEISQVLNVKNIIFPFPLWLLKLLATITFQNHMYEKICNNLQIDITKSTTMLDWKPPLAWRNAITKIIE